jgi:hypothetical protein
MLSIGKWGQIPRRSHSSSRYGCKLSITWLRCRTILCERCSSVTSKADVVARHLNQILLGPLCRLMVYSTLQLLQQLRLLQDFASHLRYFGF